MKIIIKNDSIDRNKLWHELWAAINSSRFSAEFDWESDNKLKIKMIRLRNKKEYCGNHPNACEVQIGRSRKGTWLEGADWVSFNDLLNDVCDELEVDANIYSSVCWIRKGKLRRVNYGSHIEHPTWGRVFYEWDRDGDDIDYVNCCGQKAPASTYPYGTPGFYTREFSPEDEMLSWKEIIDAGKQKPQRNFDSRDA